MTITPHRESDEGMSLKVTRSVPAWTIGAGAIATLVAIVAQAVTFQQGQVRHGELISDQSKRIVEQSSLIKDLTAKIDASSDKAQDARLEFAHVKFRLDEMDRRLTQVERNRAIPRP